MDYFAGLDISMDETHVCVPRSPKAWWFARARPESTAQAVAGELAKAPSCRPDRVRDRTNGTANPVSRAAPTGSARSLCPREPAGLPGAQVNLRPHKSDRNDARGAGTFGSSPDFSSLCM